MAVLTVSAPPSALAAEAVPAALMHDGAPLDPLCFESWIDAPSVDVTTCGTADYIVPVERGVNADAGWHGYTYRLADLPEDAAMRGWVAWRYLGETDAGHVVETYHHGGGTGHFTGVQTVRRDGDRLHLVETHMGGDRCNGGVAAAAVAGGAVAGSVNITPYDLLALALGEQGVPFEAYDDIASCAICCVGTATFVGDDLAWVTLDPPEEGFAGTGETDTPQACLDALPRDSRRSLSPPELARLGRDVLERCAGGG
ncbi:hypothetical protein C882_3114 [Caenispirillum salinarum AK4]|uniref:Uncharacterized protein n=1 Tax=Caenispirillum salinarum AK4 TaxID=1238182 RepID=K9H1C1_9PROT|nr:hypothetical protein C882_3114 [Caenispirillum salinarum AK4]